VEDATARDKATKALVEPILMRSPEETVHRLPTVLIEALAALQADRVTKLATAWSKALCKAKIPYAPVAADAREVLVEIGKLGRVAARAQSDVYAYIH
jgi:dihydroneopterin aldolase